MKKLLVCLAVSAMLCTGCSFLHKNGIVEVNGQVITQADFDKAFDRSVDKSMLKAFGGSKNFLKSDENPMYAVFKEKVMGELIIKTLLDAEIERRGIDATKEDIQKELEMIISKVGSQEELNKILKDRGVSNSRFMEDVKTQIKIRKLVNSVEKIKISDADAQKYYDTHKQEFIHGEQVRASHILISANLLEMIRTLKEKNPEINPTDMNAEIEKQMAKQKAKAEAILAEVKKNPDNFAKIASQKSDDKASAERGGELGFFQKDVMVPEFSQAAFSMKPNTISDLVQTNYGYHIIKVTDRIEAGQTPFAKVKDELKFYLETQKQVEILKALTASLMKQADIKYLDESFDPNKQVKKEEEKPVKEQKKEDKKEEKK